MHNKKSKPIFRKILLYMGILTIIQTLVLSGVIFGGGVVSRLNRNAQDILSEVIHNRKNYIETEMINTWSNIETTVSEINLKTQNMLDTDKLGSIYELDDSSDNSSGLIREIIDDLIALMRANKVTGAYIMFNCESFDDIIKSGTSVNKPGVYFSDLDPRSIPSEGNMDILIEKAPVQIVQNLLISTSSAWRPMFELNNGVIPEYIYEPFQKAYNSGGLENYADFAYWGMANEYNAITYSVPLILDDGTVYGILGIDLSVDYLKSLTPYSELAEEKTGSYIIAIERNDDLVFDNVMINGPVYRQYAPSQSQTLLTYAGKNDSSRYSDYYIDTDSGRFYSSFEYLTLYNTNTPFANQRWALIGTVRTYDLFAFSNRIMNIIIISIILTFICGIAGSYIASKTVSSPIVRISKMIDSAAADRAITFDKTGISEIDILARSIEKLNSDVIDSAFKFTQIMDMAVVKIACVEINYRDNTFFITDKFFKILQNNTIDPSSLTAEKFIEIMRSYDTYKMTPNETGEDITESIYKIPASGNQRLNTDSEYVYVRFKYLENGESYIALVEDVTKTMIEKIALQHERDHDMLTGLLNRRAFHLAMNKLFNDEKALKCAALVMMDLDDLKFINESYGHEYGDKYIRATAECIVDGTPKSTVVSRISGDEFFLFFYGYSTEKEIRDVISALRAHIAKRIFVLPNQETCHIKISGGISWYPADSTKYDELMKYSDYAMNNVKKSVKGVVADFDISAYNREAYLIQNKAEFLEIIEKSLVTYHFQPIMNARTGEIFAYEAFMRANMPTLKNPNEIILLAQHEGKLNQIEMLTWFKAMETYSEYIETESIKHDCKVFINSISGQTLSELNFTLLEEKYSKYLKNVVLEIDKDERINSTSLKLKRDKVLEWGAQIAIENDGSPVTSEALTMLFVPNYIKINMRMISEISSNPEKCDGIRKTIEYGHSKGMKIIAEKIETESELKIVKALGVDYFQGDFIAKPSKHPRDTLFNEKLKEI